MSEAVAPLVARSYTRARRHPWVLGKLAEWVLPLGPYTPAQLVVAGVGAVALIKTYGWWAPVLGPLPPALLVLAVWAVRSARIGGRVPAAALWGVTAALAQPRAGRIGGRTARDRPSSELLGGFYVTDTTAGAALPLRIAAAPAAQPVAQAARSGTTPMRSAAHVRGTEQSPAPVPEVGGAQTVLQRLLAERAVQK